MGSSPAASASREDAGLCLETFRLPIRNVPKLRAATSPCASPRSPPVGKLRVLAATGILFQDGRIEFEMKRHRAFINNRCLASASEQKYGTGGGSWCGWIIQSTSMSSACALWTWDNRRSQQHSDPNATRLPRPIVPAIVYGQCILRGRKPYFRARLKAQRKVDFEKVPLLEEWSNPSRKKTGPASRPAYKI